MPHTVRAQRHFGVAYYDVDRLYDTIPSLFYDDSDFTPSGRLGWNSTRYNNKIRNTAAVIDSMQMPIMALYGIENEATLQDLLAASEGDYTYIHRTNNSLDGMDFALIFYADLFYPTNITSGRNHMIINGETRDNIALTLLLTTESRTLPTLLGELRHKEPSRPIIVAGECGKIDPEKYGLKNALQKAEQAGRGNRYVRGWMMHDTILIDTLLRHCRGDVFLRREMVDKHHYTPLPTFDKSRYIGGYGCSLPIFVEIITHTTP